MSEDVTALSPDLMNEALQLLTEIKARVEDAIGQTPICLSRRLITSLENRVKELDQLLYEMQEMKESQRRRAARASRGSPNPAIASPVTDDERPA